ncbi:winged helix-turn-helix domain-containing protein [Alicyclobacillus ferrooxydans]|uniref:winged helix-turn-helix domain-containing protein n=1 Tax=Alicyclobacillus ferrooxydans TaxID=471514 RepID=UPI0006D57492|nr:winged helix-turn-helix domain-containing protein [Alicyclobacillus ferrooxydans]
MFFLDDEHLSLVLDDEPIQLLPKEYQLLKFLIQHPNRTFTREALLDAVWTMESPVDRTVDDHIYRLRKKLGPAAKGFQLETVRGRGYRLLILSEDDADKPGPRHLRVALPTPQKRRNRFNSDLIKRNPLLKNPAYRQHVRDMYRFYVVNGTGQGIKAMADNPEVFGIQMDTRLDYAIRFMEGDYQSIIQDDTLPLSERLFWLLSLYDDIQFDHASTLVFMERAIESYVLRTEHHLELITFDLPMLYLKTGQREKAVTTMADSEMSCSAMPDYLDGYIGLVRIRDAMFSLFLGDTVTACKKLDIAKKTVYDLGWQRESAYLQIVEGFFAWAVHENAMQADLAFDAGLQHLKEIGFVHYYIGRLHEMLYFFDVLYPNPTLYAKYQRVWQTLSRTYNLPLLAGRLREYLTELLL